MDFFASLAFILSGHAESDPVPETSTPIDANVTRGIGVGSGGCVVA